MTIPPSLTSYQSFFLVHSIIRFLIDVKKVYDTVNQEKMLDCLEHLGLRGWLGVFLEELYRGGE